MQKSNSRKSQKRITNIPNIETWMPRLPNFPTGKQVTSFIRQFFDPQVRFDGKKFNSASNLLEHIDRLVLADNERAKELFSQYVYDAMSEYIEVWPLRAAQTSVSRKNDTGKKVVSSLALLRKTKCKANYNSADIEMLRGLFEKVGIAPYDVLWRATSDAVNSVSQQWSRLHEASRRELAFNSLSPTAQVQQMLKELVEDKTFPIDALITGIYALGASSPDIHSVAKELAAWASPPNNLDVTFDYLVAAAEATVSHLDELFELEPELCAKELVAAGYIRPGLKGASAVAMMLTGIQLQERYKELSPVQKVQMISRDLSAAKSASGPSPRASNAKDRCPLCGETPCGRGSQCFNED